MARPGITYEQVRSAANKLLQQGISPSIQKIREFLGTGSNTTIAAHLRSWQNERSEVPEMTLPPSVPEQVINALEAFWGIAFAQAESQFIDYREQTDLAVAQAERQRDAAAAALELVRDEVSNFQRRLAKAQAKAREVEKHLFVEEERTMAAEAQITALKERLTQSQQEIAQLRNDATAQSNRYEEALLQLRSETDRRLAEAEQRLAFERERGEANETRLATLLDRVKTEHNHEKASFASERTDWKKQESALLKEMSAAQQELMKERLKVAAAEDTNRRLMAELQQADAATRTERERYLKTARFVDGLRATLKAANADRRRLQQCLADGGD